MSEPTSPQDDLVISEAHEDDALLGIEKSANVTADVATNGAYKASSSGPAADTINENEDSDDDDSEDIEAVTQKPLFNDPPPERDVKPLANPRSNWLAIILTFFTWEWATPQILKWLFVRPYLKDVWALQSKSDSKSIGDRFEKIFKAQQPKGGNVLLRSLAQLFGLKFTIAFIVLECRDLMSFFQPIFLQEFMKVLYDHSTPQWRGYLYGCLIALAQLLNSVCNNQYMQMMFCEVGMQMKAALATAVYRKSLRLSTKAKARRPAGQVINLIASDCEKPLMMMPFLMFGFSSLISLCVNTGYLFYFLQLPAFAGLIVLLLLVPYQFGVIFGFGKFRMAAIKLSDTRMKARVIFRAYYFTAPCANRLSLSLSARFLSITIGLTGCYGFTDFPIPKAMNEVLNGIRIIKFFTWEKDFETRIKNIRFSEMKQFAGLAFLRALLSTGMTMTPVVISVACFATVVIANGEGALSGANIFPSLTAINQLRVPLTFMPLVFSSWIDWLLSVGRLNSYLNEEEDTTIVGVAPDETPIIIRDGQFEWELPPAKVPPRARGIRAVVQKRKAKRAARAAKKKARQSQAQAEVELTDKPRAPVAFVPNADPSVKKGGKLVDINVNIKKGSLTIIVGPVGSGKSSLLNALLGDMRRDSGEVLINGRMAYCQQQAWIKNDSVRANILFGQPWSRSKYETILKVCALERDLEILTAGDQTEIGEKGVTLSGGQKQRIALARAVYNDADIILLDDVLSAVDAHVGKYLFEECITKFLGSKTRVLVTHQIQYLQYADQILVMDHGEICEAGNYTELMAKDGVLAKMVREFTTEHDEEKERAHEEEVAKRKKKAKKEAKKRAAEEAAKAKQEGGGAVSKPSPAAGKTMTAEERSTGVISPLVIFAWLQKFGGPLVYVPLALLYVLSQGSSTMTDWFLSQWVSRTYPYLPWGSHLGIYISLGVLTAILTFSREVIFQMSMLVASKRMHDSMLARVMRAPMSFFDTTPLGRILSRFSGDLTQIDAMLSMNVGNTLQMFLGVVAAIVLICVALVWFLIALVILIPIYVIIGQIAMRSTRELKRIEANCRSPVYAHLSESINGASTIRAYGRLNEFMNMNEKLINNNIRAFFATDQVSRWMTVRMEFIGCCIVFITAMLAQGLARTGDQSINFGLPVSYSLQITLSLTMLLRNAMDTEMGMNCVERIIFYTKNVPQEAPAIIKSNRPPKEWPQKGEIVFDDVCARYRPELPQVLRNVTFTIRPSEKIGVVGRTGSGKSTTMQLLYRIMEMESGSVKIDDVDISKIGLQDLRRKLSIIPQEAVLFTGTVRSNLDPFGEFQDHQLWDALEKAHMRDSIMALDKKLESVVVEGGTNFSVGQRQLLCLARAICKNSRILIMDEASANLDFESDALVQKTIRECFVGCTRLTIAHRLNTIIDSDRVLVLDQGQIIEFDTPANLLRNADGVFTSLINETGEANATVLKKIAFGELAVDELYKNQKKGGESEAARMDKEARQQLAAEEKQEQEQHKREQLDQLKVVTHQEMEQDVLVASGMETVSPVSPIDEANE